MTVEAPCKVKQTLVAVLRSVCVRYCEDDRGKVGLRLHRTLERIAPEVTLEGLRLLFLREDNHVKLTLVYLIKRASVVVVFKCHECERYICILTISTGRDSCSVRRP